MNKKFIVISILFLLVAVVILLVRLFLSGNRTSNTTENLDLDIPNKEIRQVQLERVENNPEFYEKNVFIDESGSETPLGIDGPETQSDGTEYYTIYGKLLEFQIIDGEYLMSLSTTDSNDIEDAVVVNLGESNQPLNHVWTNFIAEDIPSAQREGENKVFRRFTELLYVGDVYELYSDNINAIFKLTFVTRPSVIPRDCNEICQKYYDSYDKHNIANNNFFKLSQDVQEIGGVTSIERSR